MGTWRRQGLTWDTLLAVEEPRMSWLPLSEQLDMLARNSSTYLSGSGHVSHTGVWEVSRLISCPSPLNVEFTVKSSSVTS